MIGKIIRYIYSGAFYSKILKKRDQILTSLKTNYYRRKSNITLGDNTSLFYKALIIGEGDFVIGKNLRLGRSHRGYHAGMPFYTYLVTSEKTAKIKVGDNSRINAAAIHAYSEISIGNNCLIASGVHIIDSNGHELLSNDRTVGMDKPSPISIGNNVWIGLNAVILKGTIIGDNSVVAAGSIVKGIFPPNSLIQGNPARIVKTLDICNYY